MRGPETVKDYEEKAATARQRMLEAHAEFIHWEGRVAQRDEAVADLEKRAKRDTEPARRETPEGDGANGGGA